MSIGYANICSSVHDHRSSIGYRRTNERNGIYKKEVCVARKHLKNRAFED